MKFDHNMQEKRKKYKEALHDLEQKKKALQDEEEKFNTKLQEALQTQIKLKEQEEKMRQLQEQLQIAQRKAEQGSMQMQGEVQELAIEEYLSMKFPLDTIEEIKKGQRG